MNVINMTGLDKNYSIQLPQPKNTLMQLFSVRKNAIQLIYLVMIYGLCILHSPKSNANKSYWSIHDTHCRTQFELEGTLYFHRNVQNSGLDFQVKNEPSRKCDFFFKHFLLKTNFISSLISGLLLPYFRAQFLPLNSFHSIYQILR